MTDETRAIIADYLKGCRTRSPQFGEAVQRVTMMTFMSELALQWDVILEAVLQAADDEDLAHVAAGPLEGLLGRHGPQWIERVEAEAGGNPKFARAVTGVWRYTMPDEVWERVTAIKSRVPKDQWLADGRESAT